VRGKADEVEEFLPEEDDDGEDGADLDEDVEVGGELFGDEFAHVDLGELEVPGGGNREELGDAFDDAEENGFDEVFHERGYRGGSGEKQLEPQMNADERREDGGKGVSGAVRQ
jgi:hypothetical protein